MKKVINFIKEIKWGIAVALILLLFTFLLCLIAMSDKYDKELTELRLDNKKLSHELKQKKKDNLMMGRAIESLLDQVNGKKAIECEHGVYEYEQGYIIDGYYYEFKGEADIQMEQ